MANKNMKLSRRDLLKLMGAGGTLAAAGSLFPSQLLASVASQIDMSEEVTIRIMLPGDRPDQMDQIIAEAEARMAAEGMNTKLDIQFIPWGADLQSKPTLALAAGEEVDLVFDAPWNTLLQNTAQEFYIQLDGPDTNLLETYGPNILAARPEAMWEANKINGRVMAIPLGTVQYQGRKWMYRSDIKEEVGFGDIVTFEDFEAFLYAAKEGRPDMIPCSAAGVTHALYHDFDTSLRGVTNPDIRMIYRRGNDTVIRSMFDDLDPTFWGHVMRGAQWQADGLVPSELDPGDIYRTIGGRTVAEPQNGFGVTPADAAAIADIGGELGWVTFFDQSKKRVTNFLQFNFIALAHSSPNPERALAFLNWANQQENYDLLAYGIQGEHWEPVGEDEYRPNPDNNYRWFPFAWVWNPTHDRLNADLAGPANDWERWSADAANFEADMLLGFTPDNDPVINEVSQLNSLRSEFYTPLDAGLILPEDVEDWWASYSDQAQEAAARVVEEYQRQADAFLESQA